MLGEILCTACFSSEPHGNVVRKHADGTCSCFVQHVNKAQERRMCPESELGLHVYAGHTIKKYMIALSDDTRTKFIGEIDFELYAIW